MTDSGQRFRNCCITFFNAPKHNEWDMTRIKYYKGQKEKCPTTGKEHWQYYLEFNSQYRMVSIKTYVQDPSCHIEERKKVREAICKYVWKDESSLGERMEGGSEKKPGHRSDLDGMYFMCKEGKPLRDVLDTYTGMGLRHINVCRKAQEVYHNPDDFELYLREKTDKGYKGSFGDWRLLEMSRRRGLADDDIEIYIKTMKCQI